jgi:hypothetical protein
VAAPQVALSQPIEKEKDAKRGDDKERQRGIIR